MEKRVGFIGCYSHDVILMLAKVLGNAKRSVLVVDRNKHHTLESCVPVPEGLSPREGIISYDGVSFTSAETKQETEERYQVVFLDFGMSTHAESLKGCSDLILITDMLPHHLRQLELQEIPKDLVKACILRDVVGRSWTLEQSFREFMTAFPNRREFYLAPDFRDVKNRYVCEVSHEYRVSRASAEMREIIYTVAKMLCPEVAEKALRRRMRVQEGRCYS